VELMWGVGPVTKARLTAIGVHTADSNFRRNAILLG
jgi:hypothetical protein